MEWRLAGHWQHRRDVHLIQWLPSFNSRSVDGGVLAKQDYVLKKYVKAATAAEALGQDNTTEVSEVFLVEEKPKDLPAAVGFHTIHPDE